MLKVLVAQLYPTLVTPWTPAHQALQFMGFSRQEYWSGLPFTSPGDLPHPGMCFQTQISCIAGGFSTLCATAEAHLLWINVNFCTAEFPHFYSFCAYSIWRIQAL